MRIGHGWLLALQVPPDDPGYGDRSRCYQDRTIETPRHALPPFAQIIAEGEETGDPDAPSRPGVQRKRPRAKTTRAGDESGEVPNAGDEITEKQGPLSEAFEPFLSFRQMTADVPLQQRNPLQRVNHSGSPQEVAQRDAAKASGGGHAESRERMQLSAVNGDAGEDKDRFIGYQGPDDAQHQKSKYREVAVTGQELVNVKHWKGYRLLPRRRGVRG